MRKFDQNALVEEELHDLKLRYELLEGDRKAFYETSQWSIKQNKEEIVRLRAQNKQLTEDLMMMKTTYGVGTDTSSTRPPITLLDRISQKNHDLHKRYDELTSAVKQRESVVVRLEEQLQQLKQEESLVNTVDKESDSSRIVETLENKVDKATIKYGEAITLKKTYDQIVKLLQDEQIRFDLQLQSLSKTLKQKRLDSTELESMVKDAESARDFARNEYQSLEARVTNERKERENEIARLKELIRMKRQVDDKLDRKSKQVDEPHQQRSNETKNDVVTTEKEKQLNKYVESLKMLKEATGISTMDEVVVKFQDQQETRQRLLALKDTYDTTLAQLKVKADNMAAELREAFVARDEKRQHAARLSRELGTHLQQASARQAEVKGRHEKSAQLLSEMKTGIQHLLDRLEGVHLPEKSESIRVSNETLDKCLVLCKRKIVQVSTTVRTREENEGELPLPATAITQAVLPRHNVRVPLGMVGHAAESEAEEEDDDDVPDRDTLKKYTAQMLAARSKAKKPNKKRGKGRRDQDEA